MRLFSRSTPALPAGPPSFLPVLILALVVLSWIYPCQSSAQTSFRITGIVVNGGDASPLRRCHLTATLSGLNRGATRQPLEVQSDDHGRFALDLPSAGTWRLTASARNVHAQPYEDHDGFFTGIVLNQAHPTYDLIFRAKLDAVLSGTVLDEAGEAVRNAPVFLMAANATPGQTGPAINARTQQAATDDRGHYEFSGLEAGSYMVNVRARPWYALQGGFAGPPSSSAAPSPDPSLDLVYPVTWYPGTADDAAATPLLVHAGDRLEADFHLFPTPSAHLLIPSAVPLPAPSGGVMGNSGGPPRRNVQVALLLPNGSSQQVFGSYANTSSGELDMGGLAPGTYQVTLPAERTGEIGRTTILHIAAGGSVTEVGSGFSDTSLNLAVEGDTAIDPSQIVLIDTSTGRTIAPAGLRGRPGNFNPNGGGLQQQRRGQDAIPAPGNSPSSAQAESLGGLRTLPQRAGPRPGAPTELVVNLPPGRYEVTVPANSGAFLTGLIATGARTEGRFITVNEGAARLVVHLASGLAGVDGVATLHGKPCAGALILLVPASLGAPESLATIHRDQSNSDGSFHLASVIPGQYILLAIDHGWSVRWNDPLTLRPYLLGGSPLELAPSSAAQSTLQALAP